MKKTIKHYESAVDLLVTHSTAKFNTPYGFMSGREILEKIWYRHTPEKTIQKNNLFNIQRKIWGESQARILENGSVEFKNESGWYRIQFDIRT